MHFIDFIAVIVLLLFIDLCLRIFILFSRTFQGAIIDIFLQFWLV